MNRIRPLSRRQLHVTLSYLKAFHPRDHLAQTILPTFHFQGALPRLPIPTLEQSLNKYVISLEALEGHPEITNEDIERVKEYLNEFMDNDGPILDAELRARDKANPETSHLWGPWTEMYLSDRRSLPINYNPLLVWNHHPNAKLNNQKSRAAMYCWASAKYYLTLADGHLPPEVFNMKDPPSDNVARLTKLLPKMRVSIASKGIENQSLRYLPYAANGSFPLDMTQIENLFYSTRIPSPEKDVIRKANEKANHVIVLTRGRFYMLDVLNNGPNGERNARSVEDIYTDIEKIISDAEKKGNTEFAVSALSNTDRDTWTANRKELLELGNEFALSLIDDAMFLLNLDEDDTRLDVKKATFCATDKSGVLSSMLWGPSENRWVDKSFSIIIKPDGTSGLNFEHAWGDGACVLSYFNKVQEHIASDCTLNPDIKGMSSALSTDVPTEVKFVLSDNLKSEIQSAISYHNRQVNGLEVSFGQNFEVNRNWMSSRNLGADGFLQLSLQITHRLLHGYQCATYESASTCAFQHGRTETIRPCTQEAVDLAKFYKTADFENIEDCREIDRLLRAAIKVHNVMTKDCLSGEGFDRHLFGIRYQSTIKGAEQPKFIQDKTFGVMNYFRMSTSTLNSPHVMLGGFGPVVPDGYALGYMVYDNWIGVTAAAFPEHGVDPTVFTNTVNDVWMTLKSVIDNAAKM